MREFSSQQFPSHQFLLIRQRVYSSQLSVRDTTVINSTLYIARRHPLLPFYRSVFVYIRSSRRSSSSSSSSSDRLPSVVSRLPSSVRLPSSARLPSPSVRHPIVLPLYRHRLRGSHTNPIEQVPQQSCRKLCIVLSFAGLKKTTHPLLHWVRNIIKFPF